MSQLEQRPIPSLSELRPMQERSRRHFLVLWGGLALIAILGIGLSLAFFFFLPAGNWFWFGGGMFLLGGLMVAVVVYGLQPQIIRSLAKRQGELDAVEQSAGVEDEPDQADAPEPPETSPPETDPKLGQFSDNNDYYRQLVESSPDGLAVHVQDNITFINQAGARLLGATRSEQLLNTPIMDIVHPDYQELVAQRIKQIGQGRAQPSLVEEKFMRLNGTPLDVEVARYPFVYQNQPAVQLVFHDITARKQAEAEIVQRNRELTILQSTGVALTSSLDLRHVLDTVAQEMARLFEVESCAIFEWDESQAVITMTARFDSAGWWDPKSSAVGRQLAEYPLTKWVLEEQVPYQMTISQTNIDPAEFAYMRQENIKTRLILPMVFQQRVMGLVELQDSQVEHTFTYQEISLAKLLANEAASAIENAQLFAQAQQEIAERKRAEAALEEERALLAQRVAERTVELSKANAELARAARLKDEFLANMSHELRTPLNGILGSSEILQSGAFGQPGEKQLKYLKNIEESGHHLLSLITDILDLAKSEAGRLELDIALVSVEAVCEASLRLTKQLSHKKRQKVIFELDEAISYIPADERRLKQILVNLLSNAIKFTPEGGRIGLEVMGDPDREIVHFTVWDTGIGISSEELKWLFQPFVQLEGGLARHQGGTGLGLSLVYRMAELHGGSVSVESEVGEGSRFKITLPWPEIADEELLTGRATEEEDVAVDLAAQPSISGKAPLILLAEDNEENIATFSDYLHLHGFQIVVARNGEEALARVREEHPHLILMDVQMPGMDGLEATRRLRADDDLPDIPIIAITALAMPGDRERCLEAGANEYLSKPVRLQELVKTIQSYLS